MQLSITFPGHITILNFEIGALLKCFANKAQSYHYK